MDKGRVKAVLAPYSPPLSPTQIDEIANVIAETSEMEIATEIAKERALKKSRRTSSLRGRE